MGGNVSNIILCLNLVWQLSIIAIGCFSVIKTCVTLAIHRHSTSHIRSSILGQTMRFEYLRCNPYLQSQL